MREQVSVQAVHTLNGYCSRRLRYTKLLLTPLQGVVLLALYVIYQVVDSATGRGLARDRVRRGGVRSRITTMPHRSSDIPVLETLRASGTTTIRRY